MYLRVAEPIELWDGTGEDAAKDFAAQPDWSIFAVGELSPAAILASFYGNRKGHRPMRFGYVLFSETELLSTGGSLHVVPAFFGWPPEVSAAHRDLMGHEQRAEELFRNYDPATRLQTLAREEFFVELALLTGRADVAAEFRTNALKRLKRVRDNEVNLWQRIRDLCGARLDPEMFFDERS